MSAVPSSSLLYYPHYQPPSDWLRSMLLLTDSIQRIVPRKVDPEDDEDTKRLLEFVPGALVRREPKSQDINFDDLAYERLRKAFSLIRESGGDASKECVLTVRTNGGISIRGHTFLHKEKVSYRLKYLLEEVGWLDSIANGIASERLGSYLSIPTKASNLILSCIADRIASREGLDTVTSDELSFANNALNSMGVSVGARPGTAEGMLMSAVAAACIPKEVGKLSLDSYLELRKSYEGLRTVMADYLSQVVAGRRLNRIEDPDVLLARISEVARKFEAECAKCQKSPHLRKIRDWAPFTISSVFTVAGGCVAPEMAGEIAVGSVFVGALTKVFIEDRAPDAVPESCRIVASLRRDILKRSTIDALI